MKKILISYASRSFYNSQRRLAESGRNNGIDVVVNFSPVWIRFQKDFFQKNKYHLRSSKGGGYWVWKPYIILNTLRKLSANDILFYSDAGVEVLQPLDPLVELCDANDGFALFRTNGHTNRQWTKRDCFVYMGCDSQKYYDAGQAMAGFLGLQKNERSIELVLEWLKFCQNFDVVSDAPNTCGLENLPGFIENRHDQSVLSLLAVKFGIPLFRDPSQWGNNWKMKEFREPGECLNPYFFEGNYSDHPDTDSEYPTLLHIHRTRNESSLLSKITLGYVVNSIKTIGKFKRLQNFL